MIEPPKIVHTSRETAAVILITTPRSDMPKVFGPAVQELMGTLAAQGIAPAGAVFAHHLRMTPETFEFELGVPVTGAVTPAGRVRPGELPAATVARTVYHGGYEGLPGAWGEFMEWIATAGHKAAPDLWESYVTGPHSGPDPSTWRTVLIRPLVS